MLTAERVRELLDYDPETGVLWWRASGKPAGYSDPKHGGRISIRIDYKLYLAHRLAHLWMTGEWPRHSIDHEHGDPSNNRWIDIRPATHGQNMKNQRLKRNSTTGYKGVHFFKQTCRYQAHITVDRKRIHLGYYDTAEEAYAKYCEAALKYHGEFARLA